MKILICGVQICSICCCSPTARNIFLYHADKSTVIIMWIITLLAQRTPEWNIRPGFAVHSDCTTAWHISSRFFWKSKLKQTLNWHRCFITPNQNGSYLIIFYHLRIWTTVYSLILYLSTSNLFITRWRPMNLNNNEELRKSEANSLCNHKKLARWNELKSISSSLSAGIAVEYLKLKWSLCLWFVCSSWRSSKREGLFYRHEWCLSQWEFKGKWICVVSENTCRIINWDWENMLCFVSVVHMFYFSCLFFLFHLFVSFTCPFVCLLVCSVLHWLIWLFLCSFNSSFSLSFKSSFFLFLSFLFFLSFFLSFCDHICLLTCLFSSFFRSVFLLLRTFVYLLVCSVFSFFLSFLFICLFICL